MKDINIREFSSIFRRHLLAAFQRTKSDHPFAVYFHNSPQRQGDPRIVGFKSQLNYRKIVFSSLRLLIPTTGRRISRARRGSSGPPHCYPPRATINRVPLALAPTTHGRIPTN